MVSSSPYRVSFNSAKAQKNYSQLSNGSKNSYEKALEYLKSTPNIKTDHVAYSLDSPDFTAKYKNVSYMKWQYKKLPRGGRIWYIIVEAEKLVIITNCFSSHPNKTKPGRNYR